MSPIRDIGMKKGPSAKPGQKRTMFVFEVRPPPRLGHARSKAAKFIVSEIGRAGRPICHILAHRCPWRLRHARRASLSQGYLCLAHACGMLGSSGRGGTEWGGIFQFDLATQEALRRLGERAPLTPSGLLEQGADPGCTAAHYRSQHAHGAAQWRGQAGIRKGPSAKLGPVHGCMGGGRLAVLAHRSPQGIG